MTALQWLRGVAYAPREEACIDWPFYCMPSGYGELKGVGRKQRAHVAMCEFVHGNKPFAKADVAHSCNNKSCVNPAHLRWDSRRGNMEDKVLHGNHNRGTKNGAAKLTEHAVESIRASRLEDSVLADRHGVSPRTIDDIRARRTWAWFEAHNG